MRYPILSEVNPLEDDEVDRAEVEVQQCMELTVTNRSRAWPEGRSGKKDVGKMERDFQCVVLRVQCKRICGQQPLFLIYRGLVKWYDRGLQNLWWEFDSLIPCSLGAWKPLKSRHSGSFVLSKKGRVPTLGLCQNPDKKEVARQRFLTPVWLQIRTFWARIHPSKSYED